VQGKVRKGIRRVTKIWSDRTSRVAQIRRWPKKRSIDLGAGIYVHWPGATEEEQDDHSGFSQDCEAYARWQVAVQSSWMSKRWLKKNDLAPLLSFYMADTPEKEIVWTTPGKLRRAATKLKEMLLEEKPDTKKLSKLYKHGPGVEPPHVELATDLNDVYWIAEYAQKRGAKKITLLVSW